MPKSLRTFFIWIILIAFFVAIYVMLSDHSSHDTASLFLTALLPYIVIFVLILGVIFYFRSRTNAAGQSIMALRKTPARMLATPSTVRFADVGGAVEAKKRLLEVVQFLGQRAQWEKAGAKLPTGILLEGPPGCGKTLLARALAGEAKVPFFEISASEFVEMFVGIGAARVRDLFEEARKRAPAIVFIDELDAVGRKRGAGMTALSHQEREQTLNQLLVCLDGFSKKTNVIVLAATNRADVLDAALLRPGRFDLRLKIPALDVSERAEVLRLHTQDKTIDKAVDFGKLARATEGLSGAELAHLANEAAMIAMRRAGDPLRMRVELEDFQSARTASKGATSRFDALDAILIESHSQLAQSTGKAIVRATLEGGTVVEGALVWADPLFFKLQVGGSSESIVVSKLKVLRLQALEGTEVVRTEDVTEDHWARRRPDAV